jgi:hypothetical protein
MLLLLAQACPVLPWQSCPAAPGPQHARTCCLLRDSFELVAVLAVHSSHGLLAAGSEGPRAGVVQEGHGRPRGMQNDEA